MAYRDGKRRAVDAAYMLSATLTTVGYGDLAPVGQGTRAAAIVLIPFGLMVLGFTLTWERAYARSKLPPKSVEELDTELTAKVLAKEEALRAAHQKHDSDRRRDTRLAKDDRRAKGGAALGDVEEGSEEGSDGGGEAEAAGSAALLSSRRVVSSSDAAMESGRRPVDKEVLGASSSSLDSEVDKKFEPLPDLGTRLELFKQAIRVGLWRDALHFYLQTIGGKCLHMLLTMSAVVATGAIFLKYHPAEKKARGDEQLTWVDCMYCAIVTSTVRRTWKRMTE